MYGITIVYIVSSLPNHHVKSPAQCWLWRGHEQQDSNIITVAQCPQSEVLAQEGSHRPCGSCSREIDSGGLSDMTHHTIVTSSTEAVSLSGQDNVKILTTSDRNLSRK